MRNILITVSLLIVAVVTACLNDFWAGFVYFSLTSLSALCIYWGVIFILRYREDYFLSFQEEYKFYKINLINSSNLTLEEAAAYSGIGINKLRDLTSEQNCQFVLWVGSKRLIKRRLFDKFIEQEYSI